MNIITIGKRLIRTEEVAYVEAFDPAGDVHRARDVQPCNCLAESFARVRQPGQLIAITKRGQFDFARTLWVSD